MAHETHETHETLVDVTTLAAHLEDPSWVLVDCRFALTDAKAGPRAFAEATIPGAVHADLDRDLAGPVVPGHSGRHPLPEREVFARILGTWGVDASTQVVAFDDRGGAFASRLWWMMRWMGHGASAVLDGGLASWIEAGQRLAPGQAKRDATCFVPRQALVEAVNADDVQASSSDPAVTLLDARGLGRFLGEDESIDPIAGHISGARSAPYVDNLGEDGRFKSAPQLAQRFAERLEGTESDKAIVYCGSGVTACHDLLAMTYAGLPMPRLYPGSWSDWITDPSRPRATGEEA